MAKLTKKIDLALDESRMLVLGAQVLLGLEYRSFFEARFDHLPPSLQYLMTLSLSLILVSICLIMWPAPYHRIVDEGRDTPGFHHFIRSAIEPALFPFALAIGLEFCVVVTVVLGQPAGVGAGIGATLLALFFWYGIEFFQRAKCQHNDPSMDGRKPPMNDKREPPDEEPTSLDERVKQVLTEARVVLPGAQALMGFQFITILAEAFGKLPASSKYIHLVSLGCVAISTILLMTPAAYHRIVEEGENTESFHRFASYILLAAMAPLALGLCGDFYVVLQKVLHSTLISAACAAIMLVLFYGLWFGYSLYRRSHNAR